MPERLGSGRAGNADGRARQRRKRAHTARRTAGHAVAKAALTGGTLEAVYIGSPGGR